MKATVIKRVLAAVCTVLLLTALFLVGVLASEEGPFQGVQLTLGENINIVFIADVTDEEHTKVVFNYKQSTTTVTAAEAKKNTDGTYGFAFTGIAPHSLADAVTASFYVNDELVQSTSYSVEQYCASLSGTQDAALSALVRSILWYGKAAEEYTAKEGNLLSGVTVDEAQLPSDMVVTTDKSLDLLPNASVVVRSAGLLLGNHITTYFDFALKEGATVAQPRVTVTIGSTEREATLTQTGEGTWRAEVDTKPTELYSPISAVFKDGETPVSATAHYSVAAYLSGKAEDPALSRLVKCIYLYGYSAHAYAGHTDETISTELGSCAGVGHRTDKCRICMTETVVELPAQSLVHESITTTLIGGSLKYVCNDCGYTWAATDSTYINSGVKDATAATGAELRQYTITDGQFVFQLDGTERTQYQLLLRAAGPVDDLNDASYATALISFRMKANGAVPSSGDTADDFSLQLMEGASDGTYSWSNYINDAILCMEDGALYGFGGTYLAPFDSTDDYTVTIALSFDRLNDRIVATYYLNGQGVTSASTANVTNGGGFNFLYFNGYTNVDKSGMILDDLTLAYTAGRKTYVSTKACGTVLYYEDGELRELDRHVWSDNVISAPTCSAEGRTERTCTQCGEVRTEVLPRIPHTIDPTSAKAEQLLPSGISHNGGVHTSYGTVAYKCTSCRLYFGLAAHSLRDFANGCSCGLVSLPLTSPEGEGNPTASYTGGVLTLSGAMTTEKISNNVDVAINPATNCATPLSDPSRMLVGFDIKGTMYSNGLSMNLKLVNTESLWVSNIFSFSGTKVLFNGADTGVALSSESFINVAVAMDITDGVLTLHGYVNGAYVGSHTEEVTNGVTDFVSSASYINLTIRRHDSNTDGTVSFDNIYIADAQDGDPAAGIYNGHEHIFTDAPTVIEANCAHDLQKTYTCACGYTETVVEEGTKLPAHTFAACGEAVTVSGVQKLQYVCTVCGMKHVVNAYMASPMSAELTGLAVSYATGEENCMSTEYNTYLSVTGHNASGSNMDISMRPSKMAVLPTGTSEFLLSFDLSMPTDGAPEAGTTLNFKLDGAWTGAAILSIDKEGNLSAYGAPTGKALSSGSFTNIIIRIHSLNPGTADTAATFGCDVLIDGSIVGTQTKTCTNNGVRQVISDNTYFNLTVPNSALPTDEEAKARAEAAGLYLDNVAVLPATAYADGALVKTPLACEYDLVERVAPTCASDGYEIYTCPTCLDTYTEVLPRTQTHQLITLTYDAAVSTVACVHCHDTWQAEAAQLADGTSTDMFTPNSSNLFFSTTQKPDMNDGYYQFIRNDETAGGSPQPQFHFSNVVPSGAAAYRDGVLSVKILGVAQPLSAQWNWQLTDNSTSGWTGRGIHVLRGTAGANTVCDTNGTALVTPDVGTFAKLTVLFSAGSERSTVTFHYYVDDVYVRTCEVENTYVSGTPNAMYFSGSSSSPYEKGDSFIFDDLFLAVSDGYSSEHMTHKHELVYDAQLSSLTHGGHSGSHIGATGTVVYVCKSCEETFTYNAKSFSDFNDGCPCKAQPSIFKTNPNSNTVDIDYSNYNLTFKGPFSPTHLSTGNADVIIRPNGLLASDRHMVFSMDVTAPAAGISESGVNVNLKVQDWPRVLTEGGTTTAFSTALINIDQEGKLLLEGKAIAQLKVHEYTNIMIDITLREQTTGSNQGAADIHVFADGNFVGSATLVVYGTTFNDANSYITLQIPRSSANVAADRGIIYDNILIADERPEGFEFP